MGDSRVFESFYKMGQVLGDGNFSVVRQCEEIATGNQYAVKCVKKSSLNPKDLANLSREMEVLRQLDHPNIVKLIDVFNSDADMCYMVLELVTGGELFDRIIAKESYTEEEAKDVIRSTAKVLVYCHNKNLAHRDLKPENLLYASPAEDAEIKIADFGFAKVASENVVMSTMCGTPGYFAPEVITRQPYELKCDIWSLGVITYILLSGFPPFYDDNQIMEMEKIRRGDYSYPSPYFDEVSSDAKDFIDKMLVIDPDARLDATEVLNHPWLKVPESSPTVPQAQLKHVGSNLYENQAMIKAKFKASIGAVMLINRMKK